MILILAWSHADKNRSTERWKSCSDHASNGKSPA